jgi:hypothetical protein
MRRDTDALTPSVRRTGPGSRPVVGRLRLLSPRPPRGRQRGPAVLRGTTARAVLSQWARRHPRPSGRHSGPTVNNEQLPARIGSDTRVPFWPASGAALSSPGHPSPTQSPGSLVQSPGSVFLTPQTVAEGANRFACGAELRILLAGGLRSGTASVRSRSGQPPSCHWGNPRPARHRLGSGTQEERSAPLMIRRICLALALSGVLLVSGCCHHPFLCRHWCSECCSPCGACCPTGCCGGPSCACP